MSVQAGKSRVFEPEDIRKSEANAELRYFHHLETVPWIW